MPPIEHVVVLMLENRSFDCLLGKLYPKSEQFDGLEGTESNPWHKEDGTVEQVPGMEQRRGHGRGGLPARSGAGRIVRGCQRAAVRPGGVVAAIAAGRPR